MAGGQKLIDHLDGTGQHLLVLIEPRFLHDFEQQLPGFCRQVLEIVVNNLLVFHVTASPLGFLDGAG